MWWVVRAWTQWQQSTSGLCPGSILISLPLSGYHLHASDLKYHIWGYAGPKSTLPASGGIHSQAPTQCHGLDSSSAPILGHVQTEVMTNHQLKPALPPLLPILINSTAIHWDFSSWKSASHPVLLPPHHSQIQSISKPVSFPSPVCPLLTTPL